MGDETQELSIFNTIEDYGAALVGSDVRYTLYHDLIDEQTQPLNALAQWLWHMPTNLSTMERFKYEIEAIKKQKPDAIITHCVIGSRHKPGAERLMRGLIREHLNTRVLSIETAFPGENKEKVDYQIRTFLEIAK